MRKDALLRRYEVFVAAGILAAHSNQKPQQGFRQRDVKFLIELFSNWIEHMLPSATIELQNTQVQRYLDDLEREGYARRIIRGGRPWYLLTRTGLIELASRIVNQSHLIPPEHFFFVYYFIHNYRPRIIKLVQEQGKQFPLALKLELESLLDLKTLVKEQIRLAKTEAEKLEERIDDSKSTAKLATELFRNKLSPVEVAAQVQKLYPYQLNSQKPLAELFSGIPTDLARWELEVGSIKRVDQIWQPSLLFIKSYIDILCKF